MFTIFSIPKPFNGHIGIIQKNAIKSWQKIHKDIEIILYGDEEGLADLASELNFTCVNKVEKNKFGTPLLDSIFSHVKRNARYSTIVYANTDIIFFPSLINVLEVFKNDSAKDYLIGGRRIDLDISEPIDFENNWEENLQLNVNRNGILHGYSGIDYFIFNKNYDVELKSFAVGRPGWDNWFIYKSLKSNKKVIEATQCIKCIHQNHPRVYRASDEDSKRNFKLLDGFGKQATLLIAPWVLIDLKIRKNNIYNRIFGTITINFPFRQLIGLKRYFIFKYYG